jgi:hypothetical protein
MGQLVPFHPPQGAAPSEPLQRQVLTLANKMQLLVLIHPIAAREIEKLIDRVLKMEWS